MTIIQQFVIEAWLSDSATTINLAARYGENKPIVRNIKQWTIGDPDAQDIEWAMVTLMRAYLGEHGFWERYEAERIGSQRG